MADTKQQAPDLPVYLFTGFLEAGKTKFIQETLEDEPLPQGRAHAAAAVRRAARRSTSRTSSAPATSLCATLTRSPTSRSNT
ncbi:MAG: hypothetical protein ACLUNO_08930 [Oscillospiraceae bacterium]